MPDVPRLLIRGKRSASDRWRSASVSLDGLLDYDEEVTLVSGCTICMLSRVLVKLTRLALCPIADVVCRIATSKPWS